MAAPRFWQGRNTRRGAAEENRKGWNMPYNDAILNEADRQKVAALGEQWNRYNAAGNTAAADNAHAQAEAIRAKYGYSGGAGGDEYNGLPGKTGTASVQTSTVLRTPTNQSETFTRALGDTTLRNPTDQSAKVNTMYDNNYRARTAALEAAYNQKNMDYDRAESQVAPVYDTQRNDLATQFEIARQNMGERAAANGINSGTGTQIALSQQNEFLRDYGNLNKAEAQARSEIAFERAKASAAYRDAVAQALAENDVERAKALYNEAVRVDNGLVSVSQAQTALNMERASALLSEAQRVDSGTVSASNSQIALDMQREATEWAKLQDQADNLAKFGDFSGYEALGYTPDQIAQMRTIWALENPELAAALGYGDAALLGAAGGGSGGRRSGGSGSGSGSTTAGNGSTTGRTTTQSAPKGIGGAVGRAIANGVGSLLAGNVGNGGSGTNAAAQTAQTVTPNIGYFREGNGGWVDPINNEARLAAMAAAYKTATRGTK